MLGFGFAGGTSGTAADFLDETGGDAGGVGGTGGAPAGCPPGAPGRGIDDLLAPIGGKPAG